MIELIIYDDSNYDTAETRFGGLPTKKENTNFEWPICKLCGSEMQYLGRVRTNLGYEQIFMCDANPGGCDTWDPNSGANKVLIVDTSSMEEVTPTNPDIALRTVKYGSVLQPFEAKDYYTAMQEYPGDGNNILGQLYGEPEWIQADETPTCDVCGEKMRFAAQIEEGPDTATMMNFGLGSAYLFDCEQDSTAKFLWQCG